MTDILIYGGIAVAGVAVVAGIIITAVLWVSKRKLNARLDVEYGKKR